MANMKMAVYERRHVASGGDYHLVAMPMAATRKPVCANRKYRAIAEINGICRPIFEHKAWPKASMSQNWRIGAARGSSELNLDFVSA